MYKREDEHQPWLRVKEQEAEVWDAVPVWRARFPGPAAWL